MARVFAALAVANVTLLIGTAILGLVEAGAGADRHVLLAVLALLLSCFVQVGVFTYFTVTGKLIGQAVHIAKAELSAIHESKAIKRAATGMVGAVIGSLIPAIISGAIVWRTSGSLTWHFLAATLVVAVHVKVFVSEHALILRNADLIRRSLDEYDTRPDNGITEE